MRFLDVRNDSWMDEVFEETKKRLALGDRITEELMFESKFEKEKEKMYTKNAYENIQVIFDGGIYKTDSIEVEHSFDRIGPDITIHFTPNLKNVWGRYRKDEKIEPKMPEIEKVIFNPPATVVLWKDNTKTVVKCENELFDPEKGLAMAICKKMLGNKGHYFETIKKWTKPYYDEEAKRQREEIWENERRSIDKFVSDTLRSFGVPDKEGDDILE